MPEGCRTALTVGLSQGAVEDAHCPVDVVAAADGQTMGFYRAQGYEPVASVVHTTALELGMRKSVKFGVIRY